MRLEDALKQDFSGMTPQQRSHLRKRLMAANMPIPPELDLKKGQIPDMPRAPASDNGPWKATVVSNNMEHTYIIGGNENA